MIMCNIEPLGSAVWQLQKLIIYHVSDKGCALCVLHVIVTYLGPCYFSWSIYYIDVIYLEMIPKYLVFVALH